MHLVFYHANCADGFTARCIAQLNCGTANVSYTPIQYEGPQMSDAIKPRDQVTYLDYTPPADILQHLIADMNCRVLVIDHHATAQRIHEEKLVPWESVFDVTKSGAGLAWEYFFPDQPMPLHVRLVQSRDLGYAWAPEHIGSLFADQLLSYHAFIMRCLPRTFEAWKEYFWDADAIVAAQKIGIDLVAQDRAMIEAAAPLSFSLNLDGYTVPAFIGFPYSLVSEGLNYLLNRYPEAPFAANVYPDTKTGRMIYSLRGANRAHVGEVARRLDPPRDGYTGGGGHPNAAGFSSTSPIPFVS